MCWSSAFDPFEGSTLGSESVPGGRTDRSREPSRARAVRRLGVPVGMGGKANCLCLRGIWETPKPRYREETKPVVKLPGTTFVPKVPLATPGRGGRDTAARKPRSRAPSEETHLCRAARASFARRLGTAVCVFGHLRGLCDCSSVLEPTGTRSPRKLMRYRDENGHRWADIIDMLTMYPEARRKVVRLLGETQAESR
jgi:hypothetical protein